MVGQLGADTNSAYSPHFESHCHEVAFPTPYPHAGDDREEEETALAVAVRSGCEYLPRC